MKNNYDPIFGILAPFKIEEPYTLLCDKCNDDKNQSDSLFCKTCGEKLNDSDTENLN